jgi:hypothetical protein
VSTLIDWKIEDIYLNLGNGDETLSEQHQWFRLFFNGQARTILTPHVSTQGLRYLSGQSDYGFYEDKLQDILQNHYTVGIQEYFQESMEYFARKFGWKNLGNVVENVTQTRLKMGELSQDVIALIRAYNDLDVKLHNTYLKQYVYSFSEK